MRGGGSDDAYCFAIISELALTPIIIIVSVSLKCFVGFKHVAEQLHRLINTKEKMDREIFQATMSDILPNRDLTQSDWVSYSTLYFYVDCDKTY